MHFAYLPTLGIAIDPQIDLLVRLRFPPGLVALGDAFRDADGGWDSGDEEEAEDHFGGRVGL